MKITKSDFIFILLVLFFHVPILSCSSNPQNISSNPSSLNIVSSPAQSKRATVNIEIADTEEKRARGLMFRTSLDANSGMWFVFDQNTRGSFWMHNTFISLDIIFVDSTFKIVDIAQRATPQSDALITPRDDYRYVLEVNAGFAEEHHLALGDSIVM